MIFRLEFFGTSLNTPVILKSRVTPFEISRHRSADDLVRAEALDRLALRETTPCLAAGKCRCRESSGRFTTFRKSSSVIR